MDKILLIDDETDVQYSFRRIFDSPDLEIATADSGEEGLKIAPKFKPDLIILDVRMGGISGIETLQRLRQTDKKQLVIMMTAYGTTQTVIEAMKHGAYDYLLKPFDVPKLKQIVFNALKAARDMRQVVSCQPQPAAADDTLGIVGRCEAMQSVFKLIGQLAASDATALITGESGTGKELVARAIYHHSQRNKEPYLAINCAAIPENLLESELFGHEKGAFTGAVAQRIGKFEQCHRGTIFLDEIGDMSLPTQTKILRVLQSGAFERVGGNESVQVDVRVIAATNKPLEQAVAERQFREDLFYRLNVVRVQLPPLRERRDDIPLLASYFLAKHARQQKLPPKAVSESALSALRAHHWPGNVRELENAIQRAMVIAKGDIILADDLPPEIARIKPLPPPVSPARSTVAVPEPSSPPLAEAVKPTDLASIARLLFDFARQDKNMKVLPAVERELIIHALNETRGNQVQAAKLLGITRATLRKRVIKFKIKQELVVR